MNSTIPLVFISASTQNKSGGKDAVKNWVNKLQDSGLVKIVQGLIDADNGNKISEGLYKISRYSIENYLIDPIVVYAALMDKERHPSVPGINLSLGEEYKLKLLPQEKLQLIADSIFNLIKTDIKSTFDDFVDAEDSSNVNVEFTNGIRLNYPKYILNKKGKKILNEVYNRQFSSSIINFGTLFKAYRKLNMFPKDLVEKFEELQNRCSQ